MSDLNFDGSINSLTAKKVLNIPINIKEKDMPMSNYPPGVTGNEYEIAGPDKEWEDEHWECTNQKYEVAIVPQSLVRSCKKFSDGVYQTEEIEERKRNITHYMHSIRFNLQSNEIVEQTMPCGYIGDVIKQMYNGMIFWTCPRCNKDYEITEYDYYGYDGE